MAPSALRSFGAPEGMGDQMEGERRGGRVAKESSHSKSFSITIRDKGLLSEDIMPKKVVCEVKGSF